MGYVDKEDVWEKLKARRIDPYTPSTITGIQALLDRISDDHDQGFSIVDEELERGLRSVAVAVLDRNGHALGAINVSTHSNRTTRNEMRTHFVPELKRVAALVSQNIGGA